MEKTKTTKRKYTIRKTYTVFSSAELKTEKEEEASNMMNDLEEIYIKYNCRYDFSFDTTKTRAYL